MIKLNPPSTSWNNLRVLYKKLKSDKEKLNQIYKFVIRN